MCKRQLDTRDRCVIEQQGKCHKAGTVKALVGMQQM